MKTKVTAKHIKRSFPFVIETGYCDLQFLLSCMEPRWYTCGTYGWNADIYMVDCSTVIVTGYRPFGNYDGWKQARKYNKLAEELNEKYRWGDYEKRKEELRKLIDEYVKEVCGFAKA